jgi:hypothetical protein
LPAHSPIPNVFRPPQQPASFVYDDGGRAAAGFKGKAGDCVCRAIALATGIPYQQVYDELYARLREYAASHHDGVAKRIARGRGRRGTTPRNGVNRKIYEPYLQELGWVWHSTMNIGAGCKVHLRAGELPSGKLIARVGHHLVAVIDGVIHDTYDCSRNGTRCVYGYFAKEEMPKALARYWRALKEFKRVLNETPPAVLCMTDEEMEQYKANLDLFWAEEAAARPLSAVVED